MQKLVCWFLALPLAVSSVLLASDLNEAKVTACRSYMQKRGTQAHIMALDTLIESGCLKRVLDNVDGITDGEDRASNTVGEKQRLLKAAWLQEVRLSEDSDVAKAFNDLQYGGFLDEMTNIFLPKTKITTRKSSMDEIAQHLLDCMDLSNYKDEGKEKTQWTEVSGDQSDSISADAQKRYESLRKLSGDEKATVRRKGVTPKKEQIIEVDALTNNAFGLGITQWSEHRYHFFYDEKGTFLRHKKQ